MKIPFELGGKEYQINAYNTSQEKEILLMHSFGVHDLKKILDVLNFNEYDNLTDEQMKVILYRHREISLGDEISVKFKCENCGQGNDGIIEASNFLINGKRNDPDVKKLLIPFEEENMNKYVDIDVDELDIDEYEELKKRIIDNQEKISFVKSCSCMKCGTKRNFDLSDPSYIIEIMSDDTLMSLYKTYNILNFFGGYTKTDIDSMYPFERNIFVGLLKKTKEDMNK